MKVLNYLLAIAVCISSYELIERRIFIGNEVSPPYKYPFLASLQEFNLPFCDGILIKPKMVLTAAHCFIDLSSSEVDVVLHRHNIYLLDFEEDGLRSKVINILNHPNYSNETYLNDIALWKLKTGITIDTKIILDVFEGSYDSTTLVKFIGWGHTSDTNKTISDVLLESQVSLYPIELCKSDLININPVCTRNQLCTGSPQLGPSPCAGDSGGPLITIRSNRMILIGIISVGQNCSAPNRRALYTRVSSYRDWISMNS